MKLQTLILILITTLLFAQGEAPGTFELLLPNGNNELKVVENGSTFEIKNDSLILTMILPEADPFIRIQLSTHAGQSLLLSKEIPCKKITGLDHKNFLPGNENGVYDTLYGDPNGFFGFYGAGMDSVYFENGNTMGRISRPINFGDKQTLYLSMLDPFNRYITASLYKGDPQTALKTIKSEQKRVKRLYKETFNRDISAMDISLLVDGRGTERGLGVQLIPFISVPELGYKDTKVFREIIQAHGPVDEGEESLFEFKNIPIYDSLDLFFFNPAEPHRRGYGFTDTFDNTLTRIEEISMCRWIPGTFFTIERKGRMFFVQNDCIEKTTVKGEERK